MALLSPQSSWALSYTLRLQSGVVFPATNFQFALFIRGLSMFSGNETIAGFDEEGVPKYYGNVNGNYKTIGVELN